jgi:hypothetical protein
VRVKNGLLFVAQSAAAHVLGEGRVDRHRRHECVRDQHVARQLQLRM